MVSTLEHCCQDFSQEHRATREAAGLFDISHMGQIMVEGPASFAYLQHLITNDLARTWDKARGVYGHLCLPSGGVICRRNPGTPGSTISPLSSIQLLRGSTRIVRGSMLFDTGIEGSASSR